MEAKDWVLAAGVLVTFGLGIWNLVVSLRLNRRTSYVNTVTSQRIKWIEQVRQDVATFCGLTHTWCASNLAGSPQELEFIKEIDRLRYVIRLRLNPNGKYDKEIEALVLAIPMLTDGSRQDELRKASEAIVIATQAMLKEEWEKVKQESLS